MRGKRTWVGLSLGIAATLVLASCANIEDSEIQHRGDDLPTLTSNLPAPRAEGCTVGLDASEIDAKSFVKDYEELYFYNAYERDDFAIVSDDGSKTRIGPYNYWLFEASLEYFNAFRPSSSREVSLTDKVVTPEDLDLIVDALCNLEDGTGNLRQLSVAAQNAVGGISDFGGMAINTPNFPFIETGRTVLEAPSPAGLEHYTKYITGGGIIIVGGENVPDGALLASRDYVEYMTSVTPMWRQIFRDYSVRISLFGDSSSELPEFPNIDEPGGFAMGISDTAMTASYKWLCFPGNVDIGGNPVIHELAHTIEHIIFEDQNDTYFFSRIGPMAEAAISRGIYGDYEQNLSEGEEQNRSHLIGEYWAQSVEGYIMNGGPDFKNSHFSHEWIEENDPDMYDLITRYFPKEDFAYVETYCVE